MERNVKIELAIGDVIGRCQAADELIQPVFGPDAGKPISFPSQSRSFELPMLAASIPKKVIA
jgi:hypothetical protein